VRPGQRSLSGLSRSGGRAWPSWLVEARVLAVVVRRAATPGRPSRMGTRGLSADAGRVAAPALRAHQLVRR